MRATSSIRRNMAPRQVQATFWRGGTSRGLLFQTNWLGHFAPNNRDDIICSLMGSPDPDGRQIDGVGGGASSLSKVCLLSSAPLHYDKILRQHKAALPGPEGIEELCERYKADVLYRFGQVSIKERSIDWGSTCGNMVAAVAAFAARSKMIPLERYSAMPEVDFANPEEESESYKSGERKANIQVRIMAHDSGKIVKAYVPVWPEIDLKARATGREGVRWIAMDDGDARIAGVPGTAPGILIESPLSGAALEKSTSEKNQGILSTGNQSDLIQVDGQSIEVSIVDTGLPVIFVRADALDVSLETLRRTPAELDGDRALMDKLERVRHAASQLTPELAAKFSPPAPKICVVHPAADYTTTGGQKVTSNEMDILARIVSVGQLHRTIPATTLSALAAARCFSASVVSQTIAKAQHSSVVPSTQAAIDEIVTTGVANARQVRSVTVGQPAGLSTASVLTDDANGTSASAADSKDQSSNVVPRATMMLRTAREIMSGYANVPSHIEQNVKLVNVLRNSKMRAALPSFK